MIENPPNSSAKRMPLASRTQRFLDQKSNEIDQILSLPKASPITDPSSDVLTTDYVDNVASQLSEVCEQYRVGFSLPKE